jgi:hypothetical protein
MNEWESLSSGNIDGAQEAAPEAKVETLVEDPTIEEVKEGEDPEPAEQEEEDTTVEEGEEEDPEPATDPEIEEVELSSLFEGKYSTSDELVTAHTDLLTKEATQASEIEDLKQKLEVKQGLKLSPATMAFENLAKEVGEDAAPALYGPVIGFAHDNSDKLKATALKQIIDDPSLIGLEAQLMEELREDFEDGSELKRRRMESQADKDAVGISELQEKIKANGLEEKNKTYEATRSKVEGLASEALSNLSVKVPGANDLSIDVSKDAARFEAAFVNYVASTAAESGGLTPEIIEQGKQLVQNQIILTKFHDGSLLETMQKNSDLVAQKKVILKKSNPTTIENPRGPKKVKEENETARIASQLGWG